MFKFITKNDSGIRRHYNEPNRPTGWVAIIMITDDIKAPMMYSVPQASLNS